MTFTEPLVEDSGELGYAVAHGPELARGQPAAERDSFGDVVLAGRLREAIQRLNTVIPGDACEEALPPMPPNEELT